jgi:hypothetical protein
MAVGWSAGARISVRRVASGAGEQDTVGGVGAALRTDGARKTSRSNATRSLTIICFLLLAHGKMHHSSKYSLRGGWRVGATQRSAQSRLTEGGGEGMVGVEEIVPDPHGVWRREAEAFAGIDLILGGSMK